ncbi:hypothetical protein GUJ93_ZPchr0007g5735 [Zizania palustris]|uniref:Uncharacterized protein n=1 Tax=Zizania palustris TaxID=103762 RepID=A0A8J5VPS2_ZIZPA|nr:hypothetical protein GUJ93_ZPchr0007g5735 [Zizania palustris]
MAVGRGAGAGDGATRGHGRGACGRRLRASAVEGFGAAAEGSWTAAKGLRAAVESVVAGDRWPLAGGGVGAGDESHGR